VEFKLKDNTIYAHKVVLAQSSHVFLKRFDNSNTISDKKEVNSLLPFLLYNNDNDSLSCPYITLMLTLILLG
jgi:hypothetical protein